jgi:hypothetical protein
LTTFVAKAASGTDREARFLWGYLSRGTSRELRKKELAEGGLCIPPARVSQIMKRFNVASTSVASAKARVSSAYGPNTVNPFRWQILK